MTKSSTSWEPVQKWYRQLVGEDGHYYHKQIILPGVLRLFNFQQTEKSSLLDLACGPGILSRSIPATVKYTGIDTAASLIKEANRLNDRQNSRFLVGDVTKPLPLAGEKFSHAAVILALQNVEHPLQVFQNACKHLDDQGQLVIVMNHPCFRVPRQSFWQVDQEKKLQYRRIDSYYSPMKIPIQANPSKGSNSAVTYSFHYPFSSYAQWLHQAGFVIETIEEWCSDKVSTGGAAKMENRSRKEIPLFLTFSARKQA